MSRPLDITGKKFHKLTGLYRDTERKSKQTHWYFLCECGVVKSIALGNVTHGTTRSCGCFNKEVSSKKATHGKTGTKVYHAWQAMRIRCSESSQDKAHYWDKGIKVYEPWQKSFSEFYTYIGDPPTKDHTLDRIDTAKGYEPGNVRWATWEEQQNNRTTNVYVDTPKGRMTVTQACKEFGIPKSSFYKHRRSGMKPEQIVEKYHDLQRTKQNDNLPT